MKLSDAALLIAGGRGDLGRALHVALAPHCASVTLLDRVPGDDGGPVADLSNVDEVDRALDEVLAKQPINVLINTVGRIHSEPLVNLLSRGERRHDAEAWDMALGSNLDSVFLLGRSIADRWIKSRTKGVIINFSSVMAAGNMGQSAYSAAKAAIEALTVTWAKELGPMGIRTAALAPGFIETPSTRAAMSEQVMAKWMPLIPLRRLGSQEEAAHAVRFIIENDYFHGRTLALDGGLRI